jgi:hypothetical protein
MRWVPGSDRVPAHFTSPASDDLYKKAGLGRALLQIKVGGIELAGLS